MQVGLVTIVIPTFNDRPAHLRESVESALNQTYEHVEVVVVNDGSTSTDTLAALADLPSSVRVIHQHNRGTAAARNTGLRDAGGEFVLPLDADDRLNNAFVECCVRTLRADPEARVAQPDLAEFGLHTRSETRPEQIDLASIIHVNGVLQVSMYRRSDWERLGGYDEALERGYEDYEWWIRLLASGGHVRRAEGAIVHYRLRAGSLSAQLPYAEGLANTRAAMLRNNSCNVLLEAAWEQITRKQHELDATPGRRLTRYRSMSLPNKFRRLARRLR